MQTHRFLFLALWLLIASTWAHGQSCYETSKRDVILDIKKKNYQSALVRLTNIEKYCTDIPAKNDLAVLRQQVQNKFDSVRFAAIVPAAWQKLTGSATQSDSIRSFHVLPLGQFEGGIRRFGLIADFSRRSLPDSLNRMDSLQQPSDSAWLQLSIWETSADSFRLTTGPTPNLRAERLPNQVGNLQFKTFEKRTASFLFTDQHVGAVRYRYNNPTQQLTLTQRQFLRVEDY